MQPITLGRSGLKVTPIAYGTWQIGGDWGPVDTAQATTAIRRARELGINLFDTAQAYGFGAAETLLGQALRDDLRQHRDEIVIATKGGVRLTADGLRRDSSPAWIREGVDASLRALAVDYIDLYQVHWPDAQTPFEETAAALNELTEAGKIRHIGVSNFDAGQIAAFSAVATRPAETLQPPYHLFRRGIETEVLPHCQRENIGVLVYSPQGSGLLSGTLTPQTTFDPGDWRSRSPVFRGPDLERNLGVTSQLQAFAEGRFGCNVSQLALAWVLSHPAVQVAIVGSRNGGHLAEAVQAASLTLTDDDRQQIDKIMADAVPVGGPTPEGF